MKIPFTIEDAKIALALKMGRVVTKEGHVVEILDFDFKEGKYKYSKVRGNVCNFTACWDEYGKYYIHSEDPSRYINIHRLDLEIEVDDDSP